MDISLGSALSTPSTGPDVIRLAQVAKVLRRHLPLICVCALAASAGAFLYAHSVPKTYTASSSITVEGDRNVIPELQGALRSESAPDPMPWVRTEAQALNARGLVQTVISKLALEQDPEFNAALRPPTLIGWVKTEIAALLPQSAKPEPISGPDESVLNAVEQSLTIFQDNRSVVIAAGFTAQDPRLAATFVNTLIGSYIQTRAQLRVNANRGADETLVQRIAEAKAGLSDIDQQMNELRRRDDIVGLRAGSVGQQQAEELATASARASIDRAQLEASWNRAQALSRQGSSDSLAGVLDSPTISRLRDQESVASAKVATLSSRYGANYPGISSATADLRAIHAQLASEVSRIVASLGAQLKVARDKEVDLQQQLAVARSAGVRAENSRAQLDQLQQEATTRRALYQTLLQREQQTAGQPAGAETPDVRVLSAAVPPGNPSGPNTKLIVGTGGLSGAVLGCIIALLRIKTVDGFAGPSDVTRATGLTVLGTVPRALARRGIADRVLAMPNGAEVEALHGIRTRLRFAGRAGSPRTVLLTSALARSEAGDLAAAFARTAAAKGEQVLLIEGNLDKPQLSRLFGQTSVALGSVLEGAGDWRDATIADPMGPLDLLVTDRGSQGVNSLLSGVPFQNLLVEARGHYSLVVISGPAADATDTQILALRADVTILLLDARSGNPAALQAVNRLASRNGGTLTAVLVG